MAETALESRRLETQRPEFGRHRSRGFTDKRTRLDRFQPLALLGLALAGLLTPAPADAAFAYRKQFTVAAAQVVGGPLANFPALVSLTDPNLRLVASGGRVATAADFQFRAEDAATCGGPASCVLDFDVERYDGTTGTLVAWVRVPSLDNGRSIYLSYGDSAIACSQQNRGPVWDPVYREVYHLSELADYSDSTSNHYTAVPKGTVTQGVAGKIGLAAQFGGPAESRLIASDGTQAANTSYTLEAWVRFASLQAGLYTGIMNKGRESGDAGVGLGDWMGLYKDGGTNRLASGWECCAANKPSNLIDGTTALVINTWYHLAATYDGATGFRYLYINGNLAASDTTNVARYAVDPPVPEDRRRRERQLPQRADRRGARRQGPAPRRLDHDVLPQREQPRRVLHGYGRRRERRGGHELPGGQPVRWGPRHLQPALDRHPGRLRDGRAGRRRHAGFGHERLHGRHGYGRYAVGSEQPGPRRPHHDRPRPATRSPPSTRTRSSGSRPPSRPHPAPTTTRSPASSRARSRARSGLGGLHRRAGGAACTYFPVPNGSLVTDNRSEIGIVYSDGAPYTFPAAGHRSSRSTARPPTPRTRSRSPPIPETGTSAWRGPASCSTTSRTRRPRSASTTAS